MAFVLGMIIHDNSVVSQEIMHFLHKKKGSKSFMAINIGLAKVFDRIQWSLIYILNQMRFSKQFTNLVYQCIFSTHI